MRNYLIVALIAISTLSLADRRGWGLFDQRASSGSRTLAAGAVPAVSITSDSTGVQLMEWFSLKPLVASLVYSILGVVIFWVSFIIVDKITPYDLWREIVRDRNLPLAIIVAAMCLGIAIIVAAAIH